VHNPARGLIAENYVDCDPGSANSPALTAQGGFPPTVPVTNTTEPVSLLDLFNIFNLPTRQRFMVIVDELGPAGRSAAGAQGGGHRGGRRHAAAAADPHGGSVAERGGQQHRPVRGRGQARAGQARRGGGHGDSGDPRPDTGGGDAGQLPDPVAAQHDRGRETVQQRAESGFVENLLNAFYYIGVAAARYDSVSHMVPSYLINVNNGACSLYATTPVAGCSAHYGASPAYPTPKVADRRSARKAASSAGTTTATQPASTTTTSAAPSSAPGAPAAPSGPSGLVPGAITQEQQLAKQLIAKQLIAKQLIAKQLIAKQLIAKQLIAKILHGAGPVTGSALSQLQSALQGSGSHSDQSLQNLTSYLLR
jgi:hypothetical protein